MRNQSHAYIHETTEADPFNCALLPEQFWPLYSGPITAESTLFLALLGSAVAAIEKGSNHPNTENYNDAVRWFLDQSEDNPWPTSFENICNSLHLPMEAIREKVIEIFARQPTPSEQAAQADSVKEAGAPRANKTPKPARPSTTKKSRSLRLAARP